MESRPALGSLGSRSHAIAGGQRSGPESAFLVHMAFPYMILGLLGCGVGLCVMTVLTIASIRRGTLVPAEIPPVSVPPPNRPPVSTF